MKIPFREEETNRIEDPNWTKILKFLYEEQNYIDYKEGELRENSNSVLSETEISDEDLREWLPYMYDIGLVNQEELAVDLPATEISHGKTNVTRYLLSEKGFEVAHDREQRKNNQDINRSLVMLTWILAGAALIQASSAIFALEGQSRDVMAGFSIILLVGIWVGIDQTAK